MIRERTARRRDERGMVIPVVGVMIMVLMTITALVIDHSLLRNDRRADQKVADAAATAGAVRLGTGSGRDACEATLATLIANTPGVASFAGADCSGFVQFCAPDTATVSTTGTSGPYRIEIVHPVPDLHPLMSRRSAIGAPSASAVVADGGRCERIGVSVRYERGPSIGAVLGAGTSATQVHAVAKTGSVTDGERPINLLILERHRCHAVVAEGQAKLRVGAITGYHGEKLPGILAVDSSAVNPDGTWGAKCGTSASPSYGTLHAQGSDALLQADGPPGCPWQLASGPGDGCGFVELFAGGVPGPASPLYCQNNAYWPACTSTATVRPHPVRTPERRTRAPLDHRFNCQAGYDLKPWHDAHPIGACESGGANLSDTDFVDELLAFANQPTPPGFTTYTGPCTVDGGDIVIPEGNVVVPCSVFSVKRKVTFSGGNVIFDGHVDVTSSSGDLTIHACGQEGVNTCTPAHPLTWTGTRDDEDRWVTADNYDERQYSSDAAWVVFRNGGGIKKDAQAKVQIYDASVFFQRDAALPCSLLCEGTQPTNATALRGGSSGALLWYAPRAGPFDVLAMWSDSPMFHDMAGQSALAMEGVYFAPVARLRFAGGGGQYQVAAQLITERLTVTGSGTLFVTPDINRSINHYRPPRSALIR